MLLLFCDILISVTCLVEDVCILVLFVFVYCMRVVSLSFPRYMSVLRMLLNVFLCCECHWLYFCVVNVVDSNYLLCCDHCWLWLSFCIVNVVDCDWLCVLSLLLTVTVFLCYECWWLSLNSVDCSVLGMCARYAVCDWYYLRRTRIHKHPNKNIMLWKYGGNTSTV